MRHLSVLAVAVFAASLFVRLPPSSVLAAQSETADQKSNQSGSGFRLTVKEGRVNLVAKQVSLKRVVEEISQRANVSVICSDAAAYPDVSVSLLDVSIEEALRYLLKDYDTFFFYREGDPTSTPVKAVWVYARGGGEQLQPLPPEEWASTNELERALSDLDPRVRASAIEAIVDRFPHAPSTLGAVLQALNDDDDSVRMSALEAAVNRQVELPTDLLATLALGDRFPGVRLQALQALSLAPDVITAVAENVAALDPDSLVQAVAKQLLESLAPTRGKKPAP